MQHTMILSSLSKPKKEQDYLFDIEEVSYVGLQLFAKKVAVQLKSKIACKRIGVAVIGLEVPHAHIHLIPINTMDDMNFSREKLKISSEELAQIAEELKMI